MRSGATGASITNQIINSGSIVTSGPLGNGIRMELAGGIGSISNSGSISTTGLNSNGIQISNAFNVVVLNNSGTIAAQGASNGIQITGAANITNSGTICPSGISGGNCVAGATSAGNGIQVDNNTNSNRTTITNSASGFIGAPTSANYAIYSAQQPGVDINNYGKIIAASENATAINFIGSTTGGSNNTVTLYGGSTLVGGINFNKGNTQETLNLNGLTNSGFNNAITGLNNINATNGSNVMMNSSSGYELVSGKVLVDDTSSLAISGVIQDQTSPDAAASSIQKIGVGTLTLSAANTYTGGTSLNEGTIAVGNNAALGTGSLSIANGATLQANSAVNLANGVSLTGASTVNTNSNDVGLSGNITGTGGFTKSGAGTLSLSGANTYSGGTTVSAGTLLGSTSSIQGNITNNATVQFTQSTAGTYAGNMSGAGNLVKDGIGALTLSGVNAYSGNTDLNAGGMILTGSIGPSAGAGAINVVSGAILQGSGVINGNLTNAGTVAPSFNGTATNLTLNGNYIGANGNFITSVYAPATSPVADTMTVNGNASGSTAVSIINKGGLGYRTTGDGIPVVLVSGTSATNAFALSQRVAAGAYEYQLLKGGASGSNNSWYLTTQAPVATPTPTPTR